MPATETASAAEAAAMEQPFPLKRLFRHRFVPALTGYIVLSLLLIGFTVVQIVQSIYLDLAQRRAETIVRAATEQAPAAWRELMSGSAFSTLGQHAEANALAKAFANEVHELDLLELKVYDLQRHVLFATDSTKIGTTEDASALRTVIEKGVPDIATKSFPDGSRQYELYVPIFDASGHMRAVFEMYEPVGYLDTVLIDAAAPTIAISGLLLLLLAMALNRLVSRAQTDIDLRTGMLNGLRRRIESFVSATAVRAARSADATGAIQSRKLTTTLFYSDVRDFTGFAEQNSPETVVDFLNKLMSIQVDILKRHGGDVDKMIGDAILARFDGPAGGKQAVSAAREILHAVGAGEYPRSLGIGVYRGDVISGAIGPEDRRDFTVIGDTVNISARLCAAARADEVVTEAELADVDFGPVETIRVKGRQQPLAIRRWKA